MESSPHPPPGMDTMLGLYRLLLPLLFTGSLIAQGTPVPGTGCDMGLPPPWLIGSTRLGENLTITCNTPTASTRTALLIGACVPPWDLPAFLSCQPRCKLGVGFPVLVVPMARGGVTLTIPQEPGLVGLTFCIQCVELIFDSCLIVSQATRITIES